jgi:glycosyltransferase involved in cell wall biosynthesis
MAVNSPGQEDHPIQLNIVQITTDDIRGGAAIAAYRLYAGLKLFDPNVRMLVKNKNSTNPDIIAVSPIDQDVELEKEIFSDVIQQKCIDKNRTAISTTLFSYPIFGYDFNHSILLKNADIINLHWINFFCSLSSLKKIVDLKKPIVWTLHDQWLLTGGCHYTSGCNEYLKECMNCPQLKQDGKHLPHLFLDKKRELIREMNPVIVTPSNWLANIVKKVALFQDARVEVIPNSIDTDLYVNISKETARKRLNLPQDGYYLLFSITNTSEKRKGLHHLIAAFKYCMEDPLFLNKVMNGQIKLICFGYPDSGVNEIPVPLISLGLIKDESDLSTVYSAADVFLFPSIEDNLPNMVIEAMSCGTPTIAFDAGGIPEMIQNGVNGYIVEKGSASEYAKVILDLIKDPERSIQLSENSRAIALNKFSLEVQAKKYLELYCGLVNTNGGKINKTVVSMSQPDHEFLPDASDIDNDSDISEIVKETAGTLLVAKEIELRQVKAESDARYEQIESLTAMLKESEKRYLSLGLIDRFRILLKNYENRD